MTKRLLADGTFSVAKHQLQNVISAFESKGLI